MNLRKLAIPILGLLLAVGMAAGVSGASAAKHKKTHAIGSAQTVKSFSGATYLVTLKAVVDPARPATSQFEAPKAGTRLVAAKFYLRGAKKRISGDAESDASLIGSNHQSYTPVFTSVAGCTDFQSGAFQLGPGLVASGCVVFDVPAAVKVTRIDWSGTGGFGTTEVVVWWSV